MSTGAGLRSVPGGTTSPSRPAGPAGPESAQPQVETETVRTLGPEVLEQAAAAFGLLASPMRLQIVWILAAGECDVSGLAEQVGGALPAVSQHLAKLKLAGLVRSRREGRRQVYLVDDPDLAAVVRLIVGRQAGEAAGPTADAVGSDIGGSGIGSSGIGSSGAAATKGLVRGRLV